MALIKSSITDGSHSIHLTVQTSPHLFLPTLFIKPPSSNPISQRPSPPSPLPHARTLTRTQTHTTTKHQLQRNRYPHFRLLPKIPRHPPIHPTNMSWQTYVDDHLMCDIDGQGQHLTAAAIIGHDGSVWAQSANFPQSKPEEITGIMKDFEEPGHLAPTGLHLGGTKYMVIQGEAGAVIRGKKGSGGITIKKTGQALVFGIYEEPVTPGQCNMVVERLGDYLIDQGL